MREILLVAALLLLIFVVASSRPRRLEPEPDEHDPYAGDFPPIVRPIRRKGATR